MPCPAIYPFFLSTPPARSEERKHTLHCLLLLRQNPSLLGNSSQLSLHSSWPSTTIFALIYPDDGDYMRNLRVLIKTDTIHVPDSSSYQHGLAQPYIALLCRLLTTQSFPGCCSRMQLCSRNTCVSIPPH
jgi:hypothetical protein